MKRLLLATFIIAFDLTVQAGVDPEIHQLCKDVCDYLGCVKLNSGDKSNQVEPKERRTPYILQARCPEKFEKGGWACYGYKQSAYLMHGAAIGSCAVENGSLPQRDRWPFAIEYANKKLGGSDRVRKDLIKYYESDRFLIDRASKNVVKKAGGCSYLIKENYPYFQK